VLAADFVTTEDGTGIVHMAPAYGEDDKATTDTADIVAVTPGRLQGPVRPPSGARLRRASRCSTPTRRSSAT
jgi:isoleucyl-tRNA synthetase